MVDRRRLPEEDGGTLYALPLVQAAEEFEQSIEDEVAQIPTRADVNRVARRSDRNRTVVLCVIGLVSILALLLGGRAIQGVAEATAANKINAGAIDALNQARDQLRSQGVPEKDLPSVVPQPSPGADIDVNSIIQATKAIILAQIRDDPNFRGPTGLEGPPGKPCDPLANVLCVGPQGIPGAQGVEGPQGVQGQPGVQGERGIDGVNGSNAPRPVSASFFDTDPDDMFSGCVYRTTYDQPVNGDDNFLDAPTADQGNCS